MFYIGEIFFMQGSSSKLFFFETGSTCSLKYLLVWNTVLVITNAGFLLLNWQHSLGDTESFANNYIILHLKEPL